MAVLLWKFSKEKTLLKNNEKKRKKYIFFIGMINLLELDALCSNSVLSSRLRKL